MTGVRMIATAGTYFQREGAQPMQGSNDEKAKSKKSMREQRL